jgi:hypothetical protein
VRGTRSSRQEALEDALCDWIGTHLEAVLTAVAGLIFALGVVTGLLLG